MRKLIMWNLLTLDGFFEGVESWSLDWLHEIWSEDQQRFSLEQLRSADAILFWADHV
jgi:hypothetical protein